MGFFDRLRRLLFPPAPPPGPGAAGVVELVNRERARAGVPALTEDPRLTAAAGKWAAAMAAAGRTDHGDAGARLLAAGYRWTAYAENVAEGQPTPGAVVAAWMASPPHRRNILSPSFRSAGAGTSGAFWCLDLAS